MSTSSNKETSGDQRQLLTDNGHACRYISNGLSNLNFDQMGNKQSSGSGNGQPGQASQSKASSYKSPKFINKFKGHRNRTASSVVDTVVEEEPNGNVDEHSGNYLQVVDNLLSPDVQSVYIDALSHLNSPDDVFNSPIIQVDDGDLLASIDVQLTSLSLDEVDANIEMPMVGTSSDRKGNLHLNLSDKTSTSIRKPRSVSSSSSDGGIYTVLTRPSSASSTTNTRPPRNGHRSSSLSSSMPLPTFCATKHRKVILSPISSPNKTPTNENKMYLEGNLQRKVASLTLDGGDSSNTTTKLPKAVPQKLDISQLERFEGKFDLNGIQSATQIAKHLIIVILVAFSSKLTLFTCYNYLIEGRMLVNWLASALVDKDQHISDRGHVSNDPSGQVSNKKAIVGQVCAYLLAAGVLKQAEECESSGVLADFRVSCKLYPKHVNETNFSNRSVGPNVRVGFASQFNYQFVECFDGGSTYDLISLATTRPAGHDGYQGGPEIHRGRTSAADYPDERTVPGHGGHAEPGT